MFSKRNTKGFALIGVILVIAAVVAAGVVGGYIWHVHHKPAARGSDSLNKSSTQKPSTSQQSSPYAGWGTYCDSMYKYCFKYPTDWKLTVETTPEELCAAGQITITNPTGSISMSYQNVNNHDGGVFAITPISIDKLDVAGQELTVIGSYSDRGGSTLPSYAIVDTSWLSTYPLAVGKSSQFPEPAEFTDQTTSKHCAGSFSIQPTDTPADAKAWFSTADAKVSLQILKSFYHEQ